LNISEVYNKLWAEEFDKIFMLNIKSNTPIQLIYTSITHSAAINSKGKVFLWGWNNHSQCGISSSSK